MVSHPFFPKRNAWFVVVVFVASSLFAQSAEPLFPDPGHPHMSRDQQRQLGLQAASQVYQQMPVLPDSSPETQYIRQLGQKLVATIPAEYSWPFEFHVVAQKEINAFALPGGPMFVNIGTLTAAQNEAELAGVMAHEMSHVIMQHSAKQASKAENTSLWAGLAGAVAGATLGGTVGQLAQMGIGAGAQGLMLKYSRTDESQADAVGAIILYKAGYNPQALADFFKTLETQGGQTPPQWLSDHPNPGNREQAIEKEIHNWPPENYQSNTAAFQKAKAHGETVKAYTGEEIAAGAKSGQWASLNQRNGATFNPGGTAQARALNASAPAATNSPDGVLQSVLPSQRMVPADLGPLKLSRPENWQITMPSKQGESVTIAPPQGITNQGVGYGVVINGEAGPQGQKMTIDELTNDLLDELEKGSNVKPVGNRQSITIGGVEGRSVMLQSVSPFPGANGQQQPERDWLVTIPRSTDTVIYFVFVAPQSQFDHFRPAFESMLKSVQF